MTKIDLDALLTDIDGDAAAELKSMPDVVEKGDDLDLSALKIDKREWHRLDEAVAVVADLKSSTRIGLNKKPASTASIYEASTGGVVQILSEFEADFVAIQGDGAFGLFWGKSRLERAVCAGITVKTFSERHLVPRLEAKWPDDLPETGLKVGIAASPLLVKRVGIPRTSHQEPVWAGNAVNYAAKAAQHADRHQMIVTGSVWDWVSGNDYLAVTCDCAGASPSLWKDVRIGNMPGDDGERDGKVLNSLWCKVHGSDFCAAVLAGETVRDDAHESVVEARAAEAKDVMRLAASTRRRDVRARRRACTAGDRNPRSVPKRSATVNELMGQAPSNPWMPTRRTTSWGGTTVSDSRCGTGDDRSRGGEPSRAARITSAAATRAARERASLRRRRQPRTTLPWRRPRTRIVTVMPS